MAAYQAMKYPSVQIISYMTDEVITASLPLNSSSDTHDVSVCKTHYKQLLASFLSRNLD
jgi:hypothetical protein